MPEQPVAISDIADPSQVRAVLYASNRLVHAPMSAVAAASIHGAPTKTTPVDADEFGFWDSVGLQAVKTTWANVKATMRAYLLATASTWSAIQTFSAIPLLSGGGIKFPATQVPSADPNTLDDYEEGNYTPTMAAQTGAFTTVTTSGSYTKKGREVSVRANGTIGAAGVGTAAGFITLSLPFTAAALQFVLPGREVVTSGFMVSATIAASGTTMSIVKYDGTFAGATLCANGNSYTITGIYFV